MNLYVALVDVDERRVDGRASGANCGGTAGSQADSNQADPVWSRTAALTVVLDESDIS